VRLPEVQIHKRSGIRKPSPLNKCKSKKKKNLKQPLHKQLSKTLNPVPSLKFPCKTKHLKEEILKNLTPLMNLQEVVQLKVIFLKTVKESLKTSMSSTKQRKKCKVREKNL
jgi:hypothetical protein